jgi:DNA-binding cell septation regulator SpoVG
MSGFVVRGIKLEEGASGHLYLGFPGRKVQGGWQLVCEASNEQARARLLDRLTDYYARVLEAA